jgi:hypothetical protein
VDESGVGKVFFRNKDAVDIQGRIMRVTDHIFVIAKNVQIDYVLIVRFLGKELFNDGVLVKVIDVPLAVNTVVS